MQGANDIQASGELVAIAQSAIPQGLLLASMKIRPAHVAFGCLPLLLTVETICVICLIVEICVLSVMSSVEPLTFSELQISAMMQTFLAVVAVIGITVTIAGGIGAFYRIDTHIRTFFWYLVFSLFVWVGTALPYVFAGTICSKIVARDLLQASSPFICTFIDTIAFTWVILCAVVHAYGAYVVWSLAQTIAETAFTELELYSDSLRITVEQSEQQSQERVTLAESAFGAKKTGSQSLGTTGGMPFHTRSSSNFTTKSVHFRDVS